MLGLPARTELKKFLPKKALYLALHVSTAEQKAIDSVIKSLNIIHELSPLTVNLPATAEVSAIYVMQTELKVQAIDPKLLLRLARLIGQKLVLLLCCGEKACLAAYYAPAEQLVQGKWQPINELRLTLQGVNLQQAWENIVMQIGSITIQNGRTLAQQLAENERQRKLQVKIELLQRKALAEPQPKKKLLLRQQIAQLQTQLNSDNF